MSTPAEHETPRWQKSALGLVVGVVLLIWACLTIAEISFSGAPLVAIAFGLFLIGLSWKMRHDRRVIQVIYAMFGGVLLVLGIVTVLSPLWT